MDKSNLSEGEVKFKCPSCNHDGARRLAIEYASGLSHARSFMIGLSFGEIVSVLKKYLLLTSLSLMPIVGTVFFGYGLLQLISAFYAGVIFTRSQTALSSELSPPKRFPVFLVTLSSIGLVSTAIWYSLTYEKNNVVVTNGITKVSDVMHNAGIVHSNNMYSLIVLFSLLIVPTFFSLGVYYNLKIWSPREAAWQRSFLCERCGTIYVNDSFNLKSVSQVRSDKAGKGAYFPRYETDLQRDNVRGKAKFDSDTIRKKRWFKRTSTGN